MTDETPLIEAGNDPELPRRGADDAPLVARVRAGDPDAFGALYDRWFDRVLDLAYRITWSRDAAADVAQDAFLSAWRNLDKLEDPHAFGGWLLRIARNGALDRQRKDQRAKPVHTAQFAMIERSQYRVEDRIGAIDDPALVAEDASYVALLWDAADALGERDREVLDLSLRHGLTPAEIADVIGTNRNAANQLVHRVKQRLGAAVGARMLWRGGTPACAALRLELVENDAEDFGPEAMRVAERHAQACEECSERKRLRLDPAKMFAAIPIMAVPSLKSKVAHALDAEGVSMQGSTDLGGPGDPEADTGPNRHGRRNALIGAGVVIAVIILFFVVSALAGGDGDDNVVVAATTSTSSSTSTSTSTSSTSTSTSSTTSTTSTTVVPVVVPTTPPPTVPVTTTTVVSLQPPDFTLEPGTAPRTYPMSQAPLLSWDGKNAVRLKVSGPAGFVKRTIEGSASVCPGNVSAGAGGDVCTTTPGTYTYELDIYNASNQVVLHRELTLTVP
jgi:RNA polymerase sigma factor (sigma-70 family)